MRRILHPTDFSKNASDALQFAYALSRKLNAELTVMHVADVPTIMNSPALPSFAEMEDEKKSVIITQLKNYCTEYLGDISTIPGIRFDARLNSSSVNGIIDAINEIGAYLVVMGTKGQSKLKEVIMGSTTKKMVTKSPCPVLAVPEKVHPGEIRQIVYASDFIQEDFTVLQRVVAFAAIFNAAVTVLHVFFSEPVMDAGSAGFNRQLVQQVKYPNLRYVSRVSENISQAIIDYLPECKADLLVMFEKEKGGIAEDLLHTDLVRQFATRTPVPLLSYNKYTLASVRV